LARYRETFSPGGAKDDRPDAELLSELVYCHRDRLRAWKPDSALNRKLAFLNEGRREAVDQRTRLSNAIKSQLKVYFPLALELLDNETSRALAADLLLKWPTLEALQKQISHSLRKFFYAHNCRREPTMLKRLELVQQAKPLTQDEAVIEPAVLHIQMLARQLKTLLPDIAHYEKNIAELFAVHPDRFLFENRPGPAGYWLPGRLCSALGSDRGRWESALEISTLFGIGPVPYATAPGPKPITPANGLGAKVITPPCEPSLSNGSASSLPVGNTAALMTLHAICRPSNTADHPLPVLVNNSPKKT
jgi:Transposase